MYILGIAPFNEASACILKDGVLIAAAQEERFTRKKYQTGFPRNSIAYVLSVAGIGIEDIDHFAFPNLGPLQSCVNFYSNYLFGLNFRHEYWKVAVHRLAFAWYNSLVKQMGASQLKEYGLKNFSGKLFFAGHHRAHAASAFRCSNFDTSLIVTIDGMGDRVCAMLSYGDANTITPLEIIKYPNSLGFMYTAFTNYLGYGGTNGHEGHESKIMGLAPYGSPQKDFSDVLTIRDGLYHVNPAYVNKNRIATIERKFGPRLKSPSGEIAQHYKDIAATLQDSLEKAVIALVKRGLRIKPTDNLCVAGGSGLNCKMNGKIYLAGLIKNIFIQPAAGDCGNALGAALECYAHLGHASKFRLTHSYLGPEYSSDEIKKVLDECKIPYTYHENISDVCGKLLADKKILGWFQGRMEWGPRALGNRSIIADPRDPKMKDQINDRVKRREHWRPYCASVLTEEYNRYFEKGTPLSDFMILAFPVKKETRNEIAAAVHVDGTTRPQSVSRETNPRFWQLIKRFSQESGVPAVLNTSFNVKGEPMVCAPLDAIRCFYSCGLDYLALGNFLISKSR